jgi:hypothetical protein
VTTEALLVVAAVGAYGASTAFEIELPNASRVSPAASFGAALAALAVYHTLVPTGLLFVGALAVQFLIVGILRRAPLSSLSHAIGLGLSFVLVSAYARTSFDTGSHHTLGLLSVVAIASIGYFVVDLCVMALRSARHDMSRRVIEATRTAVPVIVVVASTAGLIVLALPRLSWAAFVVMFIPVLATRQEFARYRSARRTYDETVGTIAALAEGAGYVPEGHSARVSALCVSIGRQMSLPPNRLHELQLVGLLHDAGAVSLSDPEDLRVVDPEVIAQSTGYLLQETEHLAAYADVVLDLARGKTDLPLEGRILRVANAYEEIEGPTRLRLQLVKASLPAEDADVIEALTKVVANGKSL